MVQKVNGAAYSGVWVEKQVTFAKLLFSKDISALLAADLTVLGTTTPAGAATVADSSTGVVESALVQALKVLETKATVLGISTYKQITPTVVYTSAAGATSNGTTITVTTTTNLVAGQTVAVTTGVGAFAPGTTVLAVLSSTQFTVSAPPTVALSGGASVVTGSTFAGGQIDVMLGYAEGWFAPAADGIIASAQAVTGAQARVFVAGAAPTNTVDTLVSVTPTAVTYTIEFVAFDGTMPVATLANGALELVADGATPGSAATPMGSAGYYPVSLP